MFELIIKNEIAASHYVRDYPGKCRKLHGHTWKIEAHIISSKVNKMGMVVDFKMIKKKFEVFLDQLDHICLNDLPYFQENNPTAEMIAQFIYREFGKQCRPFRLKSVTVWESERSGVTYSRK